MSAALIRIRDAAGTRTLEAAALPVRIGTGPTADLRLPGPVSGATYALVGLLDGRPFVQVADGTLPLTVNGEAVASTRWLAAGDELALGPARIRCTLGDGELGLALDFGGVDYETLPPEAFPAPADRAPEPRVAAPAPRRRPGIAAAALYGGLAFLALGAFYLLTATPVRLAPEPAEARINVRGLPDLSLGDRWLLRPGTHQVEVTAEGYAPLTATLQVTGEGNQEFPLRLTRLPGRLVVTTVPPVPARVLVDGRDAGALPGPAPGAGLELPAGPHGIRIQAERYQPFEQTVEIAGGGTVQTLEVRLVPDFAPVTVSTVPAGAAIRVDGVVSGTTPATLDLAAGQRELRLELEGFKTLTRILVVRAGEPQALADLPLAPADGLVRVLTEPPGAAVTVAGRYRGLSPLEAELPPGRSYAVELRKAGYEPLTRTVDLTASRGATLEAVLTPRLGRVRITSEPADAELLVDGSPRGAATQELELLAVPHQLEVRKAGFEPWRAEVIPEPGQPRSLTVKLLTPAEAVVAAAARSRVEAGSPGTGATTAALVLVQPGEFRMGAPRREQGRRANETERDVRLTRPFLIGATEVTNRQFREFRPGHTSGAERFRDLAGGERPAVMLGWQDAAAYCNWRSDREGLPRAYVEKGGKLVLVEPVNTGYRLPTEAEWEWAARYAGGAGPRRYPWGDQMPPGAGAGNYADRSARGLVANLLAGYDDGYPTTAPVGQFAPNPLGLYDLGGNVAEWVHDYYTVYGTGGPVAVDPMGPADGQYHGIRGSGWRHASISELRLSYRDFGDGGRLDVGFRLARYPQ